MHCSMKNQCDWHLVLFYYFVELNIRSNIGHFFWNVTGAVITWWEDQCRPHTKIEDSKSRKYHLLFPRTRLKNGRIFVGTEKSFLIDHFQLSNRNQHFCLRLNNFQFVPIHLVSRKYWSKKSCDISISLVNLRDHIGKNWSITVFENHRKSLIQHWKLEACGQTVLPDRSV